MASISSKCKYHSNNKREEMYSVHMHAYNNLECTQCTNSEKTNQSKQIYILPRVKWIVDLQIRRKLPIKMIQLCLTTSDWNAAGRSS